MNENIDLTKILKDCPKGWKFYSNVHGEVTFWGFSDLVYPIRINTKNHGVQLLSEKGEEIMGEGKCILFPSKDQRDWSKFSAPWYKKKFDPKTLKSFDKVIIRHDACNEWEVSLFSHIYTYDVEDLYSFRTVTGICVDCIPYNDDTKHLVGTKEEAPEYYRYLKD